MLRMLRGFKVVATAQLIIIAIFTLLALPVQMVLAQQEPTSPGEEWYPLIPEQAQALPPYVMLSIEPGPGAVTALTARLLDLNLNPRTEFYRGDGIILEFSTNFPSFYIWIYEWYPPGNVPSGHWLIRGAGPFAGGGTYRIGVFLPEPTEPEGRHTWKIWLWDPINGRWSTAILRFDFWEHPRPSLERIDLASEMKRGSPSTVSITIRNTGERQQAYTLMVEGAGFTITPPMTTIMTSAKSTTTVQFQLIPNISGQLSLSVKVMADGKVYDRRTFMVNVKVPLPSHRLDFIGVPSEVKINELVQITALFTNTGEGPAQQVMLRIASAEGVSIIKGFDSTPQVQPRASHNFNLQVKPEIGGTKTITIKLEYFDEEGKKYSDEFPISIKVLVPIKVSTVIERKGQLLMIPFTVSGASYIGTAERFVTPDPIQISIPSEWKIDDDVIAEFVKWSDGNLAPSRIVQTLLPMDLVAEYRMKYYVRVTADKGSPEGSGWYYEGTTLSLTVDSIIYEKDNSTRYVFVEWNDGVRDVKRDIVIDAPAQYHAKYKTQYYLRASSDFGTVMGLGWYDAGTVATISIDRTEVGIDFLYIAIFRGWDGDVSGTSQSIQVLMNSPKAVVAIWERHINPLLYIIIGVVAIVAIGAFLFLRSKAKHSAFKTEAKQ